MFVRLSIFQKYYQLIAIDLSKQKALDTDSRAIQQIEFYGTCVQFQRNRKKQC